MKIIKIINSDPILNKYKKLKKYDDNLIILESEKVILYAQKMGFEFEEIVSHDEFYVRNKKLKSKNYFSLEKNDLSSFIGYKSHSGVFATIKVPPVELKLSNRVIILDKLTSPENVGSICRSASAFGFKTVIYHSNGVSPYLRRCIRVSTGHILGLNIIKSECLLKTVDELKKDKFNIICGHNSSRSIYLETNKNNFKNLALIIGSEGHGISQGLINRADYEIKISTREDVEHLNASNAASILMHHFRAI